MIVNNPPPPRRQYAQMVRVVRDGKRALFQSPVPYQLGKAYGSEQSPPTETRIRTLDELGINSRSPDKAQSPGTDNHYNRRESTTLYHQLAADQQSYFNGISPKAASTRQDAQAGTKSRAYLGGNTPSQDIMVAPLSQQGANDNKSKQRDYHSTLAKQSAPMDGGFSYQQPTQGKQTQLPLVKPSSLEGIAQTPLKL